MDAETQFALRAFARALVGSGMLDVKAVEALSDEMRVGAGRALEEGRETAGRSC